MKKLSVILISLFFLGALSLNAQMHQGSNQQQGMMSGSGMMQGGMMQNMMQDNMMGSEMMGHHMVMKQHIMMVHKLPYMQKQLSLTQEQQDELIDVWSSFRKKQIDYQSEMTRANRKLQNLLDKNGEVEAVKDQMKSYYDIKVKMKAEVYGTARKMKSILNEDQKKNLKGIMMKKGKHMQGNKPYKKHKKQHKEHNW